MRDLPRVRIARLAAAVAIRDRLKAKLQAPGWPSLPDDVFNPLVDALKLAQHRVDNIRGVRS
jgi:hypothetical protein